MMSANLREISEIVGLQLGVAGVKPEDRLLEDLNATSADLLNLIVALEDRFEIAVGEEEVATVATVEDLLRVVERLL